MNRTITPKIVKKKLDRNNKDYLSIKDEKGIWYNCFISGLFNYFIEEAPIDINYIVDGKFTNIVGINQNKVVSKEPDIDKKWEEIRTEKRESISKLNALNNAVISANAWLDKGSIQTEDDYRQSVKRFYDYYLSLNENGK